ncbi:MAG: GFA family protein [Pseudomonadota bacterium]
MITGSCLCGANAFELNAEPGPLHACHCGQCRKYSGHFSASIEFEREDMRWIIQGELGRFTHEKGASRVFCKTCGCKLWFEGADGWMSLEAGIMDQPTRTQLSEHIFVADKGDYYELTDGLPQKEQY